MSFATLLRSLRERAGLTQEELAARAGLTPHAVSALERGIRTRPYPHTVRSLAGALGLGTAQAAALVAAVPARRPAAPPPTSATSAGSGPPGPALPAPVEAALSALTPLLAREDDVATVAGLLRSDRCRLVTLTGLGGVGKTRLAGAVADTVAADFPDGVLRVALAAVTDPDLVLPAVGRAAGLLGVEAGAGLDAVVAGLRGRRTLLVLDNMEHLLDAAGSVAALVAACPGLVVLATSRAPLRLRGETEYAVQPLGLPEGPEPEQVLACGAGALFLERAQAIAPSFTCSVENAAALAALCERLAGIPLALELAAARVRLLDAGGLLARLQEVMAAPGPRDLPARQQTLQDTLRWSEDLLPEQQRRLLRLLSVFVGGWTLEAAEAVAAAAGFPAGTVLPALEGLVEQSLVVSEGAAVRRYRLLEPVRQYADARLPRPARDRAGRAHAAYFLALAEQAAPHYLDDQQVRWLDRVEREDANLVAALEFSLAGGDGTTAARTGWALWLYWWLRGRLLVGRRTMEAAVQLELPPLVRVRALLALASMTFAQGEIPASGAWWAQARDLASTIDDPLGLGYAEAGVGLAALAGADLDLAEDCFLRALPLADGCGQEGDWLQALGSVWLGTVRMLRGDPAGAVTHVELGLASGRRRGDRLVCYVALFNLSQAAIALGDHDLARRHLEEGIRLSQETGDLANLAYFVEALAVVEGSESSWHRVAVLLGAGGALRDTVGADVYGYYQPDETLRRQAADAARAHLGAAAYDDTVDAARALSPDDVVAYALSSRPPTLPRRVSAG